MPVPFFLSSFTRTLFFIVEYVLKFNDVGVNATVEGFDLLVFFYLGNVLVGLLHDLEGDAIPSLFVHCVVDNRVGSLPLFALDPIIIHYLI